MKLDREEHRILLLELLDRAQFQGVARRLVYELGEAIEAAEIDPQAALAVLGVAAVPEGEL